MKTLMSSLVIILVGIGCAPRNDDWVSDDDYGFSYDQSPSYIDTNAEMEEVLCETYTSFSLDEFVEAQLLPGTSGHLGLRLHEVFETNYNKERIEHYEINIE